MTKKPDIVWSDDMYTQPWEAPKEDHLADLVERFSKALLEKLRESEAKYGWDNAWMKDDWADTLRRHVREHVEKGDPRDVAAYAAFAWHHGWSLRDEDA